jgi:CRISPR-associated protein Csb2
MALLTIGWEYLTGYSVATDPSTRDRAEWPPHPARVFMALAAAWFETEPVGDDDRAKEEWLTEGAALRWLEGLGNPELLLPDVERCSERSNVTVYVPINDKVGPSAATVQSCPAITRSKQPRSFPRIWMGSGACFLHWPNAEGAETHLADLDRVCGKVTRLGHSSSLVSMWVSYSADLAPEAQNRLVRDDLHAELQVRAFSHGMLDMLGERFGEEPRRRHAALTAKIEGLKAEKKASAGKGAKERRGNISSQVGNLESDLSSLATRPPVRPVTGLWVGYRRDHGGPQIPEAQGNKFDSDILVLSQVAGPRLPAVSTLAVTKALRETIMSGIAQPVPSWVSGHSPDGQPLRDGTDHLALVPLPFVGRDHADGHLLGVALIFPRSVPYTERGRVLGSLLVDEHSLPKPMRLALGRLGRWDVQKRGWDERRATLLPGQWTAAGGAKAWEGATTWASVTPVVLDRFPKSDRNDPKQRSLWEQEVGQTIRDACGRIGLPELDVVDVGTTSWLEGSPRAVGKRRPLRGNVELEVHRDAALGDGFPPYPRKGTNAPRPQVHVWIQFCRPVIGPVILGAGRFMGYGLCKPLWRSGI